MSYSKVPRDETVVPSVNTALAFSSNAAFA
jgi:hypothetical protein